MDLGQVSVVRRHGLYGGPVEGADVDQTFKNGAATWCAFYRDASTERFNNMPTDNQSQACSTILSGCRRIGLDKWFKDLAELVIVHPDTGVRYLDTQHE